MVAMTKERRPAVARSKYPQVAPNVWRIPTAISNVYIIGVEEDGQPAGFVIIDAGMGGFARRIAHVAAQLFGNDEKPRAILLTHGHFDHTGSLAALLDHYGLDTPVFAHPLELPYLNRGVHYPPGDPTVGGFMPEMSRLMYTSRPTYLPIDVRAFDEHLDVLPHMPGWTIHPTPGHTPGHVAFFHEQSRTLIAGDAVITVHTDSAYDMLTQRPSISHPPAYATYNWHHAKQSMKSLADLEPYYLCTGHGTPMYGEHLAANLRRYAENLRIPRYGRYVHTAAKFNRNGPTYIPPKPFDIIKAAGFLGLGLLATGVTVALVRNTKK